jgi:CHAT domain-containing protein
MIAFHRNVKAGMPKDQALRQAQLAMIKRGKTGEGRDYRHPFNWAGFVAIGDPR